MGSIPKPPVSPPPAPLGPHNACQLVQSAPLRLFSFAFRVLPPTSIVSSARVHFLRFIRREKPAAGRVCGGPGGWLKPPTHPLSLPPARPFPYGRAPLERTRAVRFLCAIVTAPSNFNFATLRLCACPVEKLGFVYCVSKIHYYHIQVENYVGVLAINPMGFFYHLNEQKYKN